jgi:hypothetical protein
VLTLPPDLFTLLLPFAPLFSRVVFQHIQLLVAGALLTPGRRTIAALLRTLGASSIATGGLPAGRRGSCSAC